MVEGVPNRQPPIVFHASRESIDEPRKSSWTGIYRINRMMRFIVGANSFAHKALNRRMNSPLHQALPAGRQANCRIQDE